MPFELKQGAVTEGLPTITLAGHPYLVPRLRLRERIAIARLAPKVKAISEKFPSKEALAAGAMIDLSEDDYLVMVDVAKHALAALYPSVTRDDLLNETIEFDELFAAYPVIVAQGMSRRASAADPEGEAKATSQTNSSGEGSSPT